MEPAYDHNLRTFDDNKTMSTQVDHSTLEVDHSNWAEGRHNLPQYVPPPAGEEKICAPIDGPEVVHSTKKGDNRVCGIKRSVFFIALAALILLTIGGAIAGGVAGSLVNKGSTAAASAPLPPSREPYTNIGLATLAWTDLDDITWYSIYYQDTYNNIQESVWDSASRNWTVSARVSSAASKVKPGTAIGAAAGYPHANKTNPLVKTVFFQSASNVLTERQTPVDNGTWIDDNFSGLFTTSGQSSIAVNWNQNFEKENQEFVVLFQAANFANGLTMAKYISNTTSSYPWISNNFGFAMPGGGAFAVAPAGDGFMSPYDPGQNMMVYHVDTNGHLVQHGFVVTQDLDTSKVIAADFTDLGLTIDNESPLTVIGQDNTHLFTTDTVPECSKTRLLTHLIIYTVPDRSSLKLSVWNCSAGFVDATDEIRPLITPNTTYLALASHHNGSLYVLSDQDGGPKISEWKIPKHSGDPWDTAEIVSTRFS